MGDANYASVGYIAEANDNWGVTPATPRLEAVRITGEDLKHEKETIQSQEVRDDRQIADLVEVGVQAAGGMEFELSYGGFNNWLIAAALFNSATAIDTGAVTSDITAATQLVAGAANDFDDVPVGATVKVTGAATAANNGLKLVTAKASDGSTLTFAAGSFTADEGAVDLTLTGLHLRNGTTRQSATFERRLLTSTGVDYFQPFLGMVPDALTLNFESKQIVTGNATFLGKLGTADDDSLDALVTGTKATQVLTGSGNFVEDETVTIGATVYTFKDAPASANEVDVGADLETSLASLADAINGDLVGTDVHPSVTATSTATTLTITAKAQGTAANTTATTETGVNCAWGAATMAGGVERVKYAASTTTPVMNATANIGTFLFDRTASTECMKSLTLNVANGLRGKDCMGTVGNFDIGVGTFELSGSLSAYFLNNALYQKYLDHADVALSWRVTDALGNVMVFTIPRMKLGNAEDPVEGRNTDVMVDVDWTAILDPVTGATFMVDFFPA